MTVTELIKSLQRIENVVGDKPVMIWGYNEDLKPDGDWEEVTNMIYGRGKETVELYTDID